MARETPTALVISSSRQQGPALGKRLSKHGFKVALARSDLETQQQFNNFEFDIVFTEEKFSDMTGLTLIASMRAVKVPFASVILVDPKQANLIHAVREGVDEFLPPPYEKELGACLARLYKRYPLLNPRVFDGIIREPRSYRAIKTQVMDEADMDPRILARRKHDPEAIEAKERAEEAKYRRALFRRRFRESVGAFVAGFKTEEKGLPDAPVIVGEIRELRASGGTARQFAELLDKHMAAKIALLKMANYGQTSSAHKIERLEPALKKIGLVAAERIVQAIALKNVWEITQKPFKSLSNQLYYHSLASAYASVMIAKHAKYSGAGGYFALGLFHDIGKFFTLSAFQEADVDRAIMTIEYIFESTEIFYRQFGGLIMRGWSFPQAYVTVARYHHMPADYPDFQKELSVVNLANCAAENAGFKMSNSTQQLPYDEKAMKYLKVNRAVLVDVEKKVKAWTSAMKNCI